MLDFILVEQRLALSAVTVVAMLIGIFIIYNSMSLSVVERVKDIGILRALGARRREVVGALVLAFAGLALMLPQLILWAGRFFRWIARRTLPIEGYLAFDNLVKFPSRTALTVIAFAGSLSIIVVTWGVLASFERAVDRWLHSIFPFDLTVQLQDLQAGAYGSGSFPGSALDEVRDDPRVKDAYGVNLRFVPYEDDMVLLISFDAEVYRRMVDERGLEQDEGLRGWLDGPALRGEAAVSKNFAYLHGVRSGDEVELLTPDGPRRFPVSDEIEDFSWPRGVVAFDRGFYSEVWGDDSVTYLDVGARDGADVGELRRDLARRFQGRFNVFVYETEEVRGHSLNLVRDWFRLADAQILIAVFIGAIGIVNMLLISVLTQSRQIGLLRAVGATLGQINLSLAAEAGFLGAYSGLLGCAIGYE